MSETPNLAELLDKPLGDFPDLPDLPGQRWFYGKLTGEVEPGHSRQKATPFFKFGVKVTDPGQDVTAAELDKIKSAGFALADYEAGATFYLTPDAMKMLRRFLTSLGFPENVSFRANMKLDADGNPTAETAEVFRDKDVMFRTQAATDQGRVYINNVDQIAGVKR